MADRGYNQSAGTKFATVLVCDAVEQIKSGQPHKALLNLQHALILLPYLGREEQDIAEVEQKKVKRGFAA